MVLTTGSLISPSERANTARSRLGSKRSPGATTPTSPPRLALGPSEYSAATSAKDRPDSRALWISATFVLDPLPDFHRRLHRHQDIGDGQAVRLGRHFVEVFEVIVPHLVFQDLDIGPDELPDHQPQVLLIPQLGLHPGPVVIQSHAAAIQFPRAGCPGNRNARRTGRSSPGRFPRWPLRPPSCPPAWRRR